MDHRMSFMFSGWKKDNKIMIHLNLQFIVDFSLFVCSCVKIDSFSEIILWVYIDLFYLIHAIKRDTAVQFGWTQKKGTNP